MHVHSPLALNLRYTYRELRDARELDMSYGVALASLYGHPNANVRSGVETVNSKFTMAKSCIPYYNINARRSIEDDRRDAVRTLRILRKHVTKELLNSYYGKKAAGA